MSLGDKINNATEDVQGKVKEKVGDAKGDDSLKAEGKSDQASASVKKAGENVKDAFKS
jgi:uncharacterized protein YjbJ (UPF0337 family)